MTRIKIPEDRKRVKLNSTMDPDLYKIFEEFLKENNIYNKSKYIEDLIKKDLIKNKKIK